MQSEGFGFEMVEGFGSVSSAPGLSSSFKQSFSSGLVKVGAVRIHAVVGGQGPPLLLTPGWPQNWYAWRLVMPELARYFSVVVVDPRGTGLSDKPADGYDSATQAADLVAVMGTLGHEKFAVVAHDVGMWTAYAMAADFPENVDRIAVAEAIIPGISDSPPLVDSRRLNDFLWHINFNRDRGTNELLVMGREHIYFGHQFATKAGSPDAITKDAVDFYVNSLRQPGALRASFEYYRAIDEILTQNERRRRHKLTLPVLAIAGQLACDDSVVTEMRLVATQVDSVTIPNCGHYVAEEAPQALLDALLPFLEAYRSGGSR